MSILLFLVGFLEKWKKSAKSGNFQGPYAVRRSVGSTPRCGMAMPGCG